MTLFYTDHLDFPLPPGHRFPLAKYRRLRERLQGEPGFAFHPAPEAATATIELAHDPAYVRDFVSGTITDAAMRRIGFPWSPELVRRTMASAGATVAAARTALAEGIAGTLAGGTHHAFRDEGSGYCVFNDLAIAIASLRDEGSISRAAVIDLDVHQGDGTAKIFEHDDSVLTVSVHGRNNFPFRKQRSRVDVELEDGTTDEDYLARLPPLVDAIVEFKPDILLYQSGVDGLECDRLGRLALTHAGLLRRDEMVFTLCKRAGIPAVITLGGGYAEPIDATVEAHAGTFLTACSIYSK